MPQAIPPYLLAIAVGDISFKPMSDETGIYAEPSMVDAAVAEFDDTQKMIDETEKLFGPYRWGDTIYLSYRLAFLSVVWKIHGYHL